MHFWWFPEFCAVLIAPICAVSLSEKCLKAVFPAVWFQNHVFSKTVEKMQQDDDTGMYTYVMDVSQVIGVTSESSSSHGLVRPRSSSLTTCLGRRLARSWFQRCQKLLIYLWNILIFHGYVSLLEAKTCFDGEGHNVLMFYIDGGFFVMLYWCFWCFDGLIVVRDGKARISKYIYIYKYVYIYIWYIYI